MARGGLSAGFVRPLIRPRLGGSAPASPAGPAAGRHPSGRGDPGCDRLVGAGAGARVGGRGAGLVVGFAAGATERGWGRDGGAWARTLPTAPRASLPSGTPPPGVPREERPTDARASLRSPGGGDGVGTSWLRADPLVAGVAAGSSPGSATGHQGASSWNAGARSLPRPLSRARPRRRAAPWARVNIPILLTSKRRLREPKHRAQSHASTSTPTQKVISSPYPARLSLSFPFCDAETVCI